MGFLKKFFRGVLHEGAQAAPIHSSFEHLSEEQLATFRALIQRAGEHEPIAYLTGRAHFFNLEFEVSPDVLIPRPDTETIVENVLQTVRHLPSLESPRVLDLCTGSGCIAAAIAKHLKPATVIATDVSSAAVVLAKRNIEKLGLADRVTVELGDLYDPLTRIVDARPFDLIVSNPPYIPSAQIETLDRSVRDYEPRIALDGGVDGFDIHRKILAGAGEHLAPGGQIFLEIMFDHGLAALELAKTFDALEMQRILKDHAGNDRVLTARKKG